MAIRAGLTKYEEEALCMKKTAINGHGQLQGPRAQWDSGQVEVTKAWFELDVAGGKVPIST